MLQHEPGASKVRVVRTGIVKRERSARPLIKYTGANEAPPLRNFLPVIERERVTSSRQCTATDTDTLVTDTDTLAKRH